MRFRAAIFGVYGTLLHLGPPPGDAEARWRWLWENSVGRPAGQGLSEFHRAAERVMERERARARERGIPHPEVYWPDVVDEIAPEVRALPRDARQGWDAAEARLARTTALMPGAAPVLRLLLACGVVTGLMANGQPYTVWELNDALSAVGLGNDVFRGDLVFWSYRHGFGKPDTHAYQMLSARLKALGIHAGETLMVDGDVAALEPATARGWATFHLCQGGEDLAAGRGDWHSLSRWLDGRLPG